MLLFWLAACSPAPIPFGPGETADSDTEIPPPAIDRGLGAATLDCAEPPQLEGKVLCDLEIIGHDGTVWTSGTTAVGLRGRSSSGFPKPQFSLELREDDGETDREEDLFGLGAESDWILNGMYIDRALLRNKFAFDLLRDATHGKHWTPETVYVDLTWNGVPYGVYLLTERIKRDETRLDFPKADDGSTFLVKADEGGFPSGLQAAGWEILSPKDPSPEASAAITARLAHVEALISARDPAVWDEVDLDSAVEFVLLEEFVKNNDGYFLSHHVSTGPDGKLRFTPWDLDLSLGQPTYNDNTNPELWLLYRSELIAGMAQTPGFHERLVETWAEWRTQSFSDAALQSRLLALQAQVGSDAIARNFEIWPISTIDFGGSLPPRADAAAEFSSLQTWLPQRLAWMDANIAAY